MGFDQSIKPEWRVFYKPPLDKKVGISNGELYTAQVAVNSFIHVINPNVSDSCPFVRKRTIFIVLQNV